jgi:hypothetical protein
MSSITQAKGSTAAKPTAVLNQVRCDGMLGDPEAFLVKRADGHSKERSEGAQDSCLGGGADRRARHDNDGRAENSQSQTHYLAIGNSLVAVTLLLAMIRRGEASRVSALFFLVPPTAATIAWLLIGESMPPIAWSGMALAAAGVGIANQRLPPSAGSVKRSK